MNELAASHFTIVLLEEAPPNAELTEATAGLCLAGFSRYILVCIS